MVIFAEAVEVGVNCFDVLRHVSSFPLARTRGVLLSCFCISCTKAPSAPPSVVSEYLECRLQPSSSEAPGTCAQRSACDAPEWLRFEGAETKCTAHLCGSSAWSVWCYLSPATERNAERTHEAMLKRFGTPAGARDYPRGCAREYTWDATFAGSKERNVSRVHLYSEPIEALGCLNSTFQLRVNVRRFGSGAWDETCPCAQPGEGVPDYLW
jgi:hypothetical protein